MNKNVFVVGFMLFAIFFGAGNLIFPPALGLQSGSAFWPSMIGFVITGVGLPLLGIIISVNYEDGYRGALSKIHPAISLVFLLAIYLAIGPFFGIPRTAAFSYDLAVLPFVDGNSAASLLAFTVVYFGITLWVSLNPSKMVDRVGAILTPALLITIVALVLGVFVTLFGKGAVYTTTELETPLMSGFLDGYQTLDALASVAFAVVVLKAIQEKSSDNASLAKQATLASIVAAVALAIVYIAIGWVGNTLIVSPEALAEVKANGQNIGTFLLNQSATLVFGKLGRVLLGTIVTLACLSTSIGLVVAVSQYFNEVFPKISYEVYAVIFTLIGLVVANQGLNAVISKSVPVLLVMYPVVMTAMLLLLVNLFTPVHRMVQGVTLLVVAAESIAAVAGMSFVKLLPFSGVSMEWLTFALIGLVAGVVLSKKAGQH